LTTGDRHIDISTFDRHFSATLDTVRMEALLAPSARPRTSTKASVQSLTPELELLLSTEISSGQTLKVQAAAGTGKSTALRLYATRRPHLHALYLTFSTSEAEIKKKEYGAFGLRHVQVSTLHARAHLVTHDLHGGDVAANLELTATALAALTKTSPIDWSLARRTSVERVVSRFTASLCPSFDETLLEGESMAILEAGRAVWKAACDPHHPLRPTHDMYLKASLLSKERRSAMFKDIDIVFVDEAQDLTEAQLALVEDHNDRHWSSILVYDFRQRLYGFRHAASEAYLRGLPSVAVLHLTSSWRFGGRLASLASALVRHHSNTTATVGVPHVVGNHERITHVREVRDIPFDEVCGVGGCLAIVARSNRSLFSLAVAALACPSVKHLSYSGDEDGLFSAFGGRDSLLDAVALRMGCSAHQMCDQKGRAARFADLGYVAYRMAASSAGWRGDSEACAMVDRYGSALVDIVRRLVVLVTASPSLPSVCLLTVHAAKGGEWRHVYVHTDLQRMRRAMHGDDLSFQLNLVYVAVTRATHALYLPHAIVASWVESAGIVF
jgi:hypothetical protein